MLQLVGAECSWQGKSGGTDTPLFTGVLLHLARMLQKCYVMLYVMQKMLLCWHTQNARL